MPFEPINVLSSPVHDVETYLNARYRQVFQTLGVGAPATGLKIAPLLDEREAQDFLAGLRAGLFSIDDRGYAQSELLPASPAGQDRQKIFMMFWHTDAEKRVLFREGVCQLAAASALVLEYGWPRDQVRLEPNKADLGGYAYGVDLIVSDRPGGRGVIFGEVKASASALATLMSEIAACGAQGEHDKSTCGRSQHPKAAVCLAKRPDFFWAVCPGTRKAFQISFNDSAMAFVETDDIPKFGAV